MSNEPETPQNPRRIWPWFVLAGILLAGVLAFVWVSAEVRRVKSMEHFDFRPPAKGAPTDAPIQLATNSTAETATNVVVAPAVTNVLIAGFVEALSGGDVAKGQNIFFNKPEASCGKCHRVGTQGGDNGPALDGIGSRATPEFILESLVAPNAKITKGFETVILRLKNEAGVSGVLKQETETNLVIHTGDDGVVTVSKSEVTERVAGMSPMPGNLGELLTKEELRDLVAYLRSLTGK